MTTPPVPQWAVDAAVVILQYLGASPEDTLGVAKKIAAHAPRSHEEIGSADGARLDWLERFLQQCNSSVFTTCTGEAHKDRPDDTESTRWNHPFCIGMEVEHGHRGCYRWEEWSNGARGIRAAIDAARRKDL